MRFAAATLLAATTPTCVVSLMYDVIESHKAAPAACGGSGCASWASFGNATDFMWAEPSLQESAGTSCAQPANMVNSRPYGSWCFCASNSSSLSLSSSSSPAENDELWAADPFDNKTWLVYNTYSGEDMFASFADTASPPGEKAAEQWIRVTYPDQADAMPLRFTRVDFSKNSTYVMHNEWGSGYTGFVGIDHDADEPYLHSNFQDQGDALEIQLLPAELPTEYVMVDVAASEANGETTYISFCTSACENGKWLKSGYTSLSDAMTFKLVPSGGPGPGTEWDYCTSELGVPEQINVQVANPGSVVVSFVTFEAQAPTNPPVVTVEGTDIKGVTHVHRTAGGRLYYMHFVRLSGLQPLTDYTYSVRSGATDASRSDSFTFRSGPAQGARTSVNIYGDMGVYTWNNMGNVLADCQNHEADLIVHMGDHAYNEGEGDEVRGDGYMSAWQRTLSNCSWMPVVGNHEFYDGAELGRFLNQTWEGWGPIAGGNVPSNKSFPSSSKNAASATGTATAHRQSLPNLDGRSTATSPLGAFLSTGNFHAVAGAHKDDDDNNNGDEDDAEHNRLGAGNGIRRSPHASNTSRYFSLDYGLIHFVALDLNVYYDVDTCGDACRESQIAWLKDDLEAANANNRGDTPWIVVMSHFPFYCTGCFAKQASAMWYASNGAEFHGNANATAAEAAKRCALQPENGRSLLSEAEKEAWERPIAAGSRASIADLMPILQNYSVDLYIAGHWHYYESLYPAEIGTTGVGGKPLQTDFVNPNVTVHITTGNGGPPSPDSFTEDCPGPDCGRIPATRSQSVEYGYGRLVAHNTTHLEYFQFRNSNSSVVDNFFIVQEDHGKFPPADAVAA